MLIRDLTHSIREAGRHELLMNAAGQTSGMLQEIRPVAQILDEMVAQAAQILGRDLPARVTTRATSETPAVERLGEAAAPAAS